METVIICVSVCHLSPQAIPCFITSRERLIVSANFDHDCPSVNSYSFLNGCHPELLEVTFSDTLPLGLKFVPILRPLR